jgi:hypothetical protein
MRILMTALISLVVTCVLLPLFLIVAGRGQSEAIGLYTVPIAPRTFLEVFVGIFVVLYIVFTVLLKKRRARDL